MTFSYFNNNRKVKQRRTQKRLSTKVNKILNQQSKLENSTRNNFIFFIFLYFCLSFERWDVSHFFRWRIFTLLVSFVVRWMSKYLFVKLKYYFIANSDGVPSRVGLILQCNKRILFSHGNGLKKKHIFFSKSSPKINSFWHSCYFVWKVNKQLT